VGGASHAGGFGEYVASWYARSNSYAYILSNTLFLAATYAVLWPRQRNCTSVAMRVVRLKIAAVVLIAGGRANKGEARMAEALKLWDVRAAEKLVDVGYETKGEPSSCIVPDKMGMGSLGAVGLRSREEVVRKVPSTIGLLFKC
jgi:hypothetical protein